MLLERLGLHQCQGKYGQPVRPTGRIPFEGASVMVPPIAKHPCTYRHRWNSRPAQGPFVKRNGPAFRSFHGHPLAENVTALYSVLPVCQGGQAMLPMEFAFPEVGTVEPRRLHQMPLVKLGVNKGGR